YYLQGQDKFSSTYIRVGKKNVLATPQVIAELDRLSLNISFDSTPSYDAEVDDLDNDLIDIYLDKIVESSSKPKPLINYAFLDKNNFIKRELGKMYPTVAAILCFSDKVNTFFPQAKISCKVYDNDDVVDKKEIAGPVITQLASVLDFYKDIDVPEFVVRELLVNAIVHRDYAYSTESIKVALHNDRFEVSSPGTLPIGLNIEDIGNGTCIYRNRGLYKIFYDMGYSHNSLTGVQNSNNLLKENFLDNISYKIVANNVVATVYTETSDDYYSKEELKILDYLSENEYINNTQCQKILRVKGKQAQYILTKLVKKDKLVSIGEKKGRKYQIK
ncbi:MAG: ATP-binding protein, partial [Vampirovibrionia bacterium]